MAKREKPWKAEYAKTGRSRCRTCDDFIAKDLLRLGMIVDASRFDGLMTLVEKLMELKERSVKVENKGVFLWSLS